MKKTVFAILLTISCFFTNKLNAGIIYYLPAGSDVFPVLNAAQDGDIIELTTSGGAYNWSAQVTISIEKSIIIRATAGLASRPLITFTGTPSIGIAFIRYYPTTATSIKTLTLDGISFDGISGMGYLLYMRCPSLTSNINVTINNCIIKNLSSSNGRVFNYVLQTGVTPVVYGDLTVTNSEFNNFGIVVLR